MDKNVFYYETDAKADFATEFFEGGSTISESIMQVLKNEPTMEIKQRKLLGLFEKITLEKKELELKLSELKKKYDEVLKSKPISKNLNSLTQISQRNSIVIQSQNNSMVNSESVLLKKLPKKIEVELKGNRDRQNLSVLSHTPKLAKKSSHRSLISRSGKIKENKEKENKEMKKYLNFVDSILKIKGQFSEPKMTEKVGKSNNLEGQNLQVLWGWLKTHFEEFIELKSSCVKLKKRNMALSVFRENLRKLLECETEEELIDKIKILLKNIKIQENLVEKSKKALNLKFSVKSPKGLQDFDKLLSKIIGLKN